MRTNHLVCPISLESTYSSLVDQINIMSETGQNRDASAAAVRFVCISDTHGHHRELDLPDGDILVHTGDMTQNGTVEELEDFNNWLGEVSSRRSYEQILVVGGNHDLCLDSRVAVQNKGREDLLTNATWLNENAVTVRGVHIYGSPVQPILRKNSKYKAFARDAEESKRAWNKVPEETQVILAHTPPKGHGDRVWGIKSIGCEFLLEACERVQPEYVVFGHVHGGYGQTTMNNGTTTCINAANMTPTRIVSGLNAPVTFDVSPRRL